MVLCRCYFDKVRPRWSRTPTPRLRSTLLFYGVCNNVTSNGILRVEVESISLNVGQNVASLSGLDTSLETTPDKRRKFNAVAPPRPSTIPSSGSRYVFPLFVAVFLTVLFLSPSVSQKTASSSRTTCVLPSLSHCFPLSSHINCRPPMEIGVRAPSPHQSLVVRAFEGALSPSCDDSPLPAFTEQSAEGSTKARGKRKAKDL